MREKILEILSNIRPDIDFETEEGLITDKKLDSMDLILSVAAFSDELDVDIKPKDLLSENFDSLDDIVDLIKRLSEV